MDSDITGVEFESDIGAESSVELNAEWVAWLEGEPVPGTVEGVDEQVRHGDTGVA